jgi:hypothetical protein
MLRDGELAVLAESDDLGPVNEVAHSLGLVSVPLIRREESAATQEGTVITHAGRLPLIWVAAAFGDGTAKWARDRGPMTLLVDAHGPLSDDERHRIERFVAILGRQSE